jgi:hypothetical protein
VKLTSDAMSAAETIAREVGGSLREGPRPGVSARPPAEGATWGRAA